MPHCLPVRIPGCERLPRHLTESPCIDALQAEGGSSHVALLHFFTSLDEVDAEPVGLIHDLPTKEYELRYCGRLQQMAVSPLCVRWQSWRTVKMISRFRVEIDTQ
jgi:hypothetical protein